MKASEFSKVIKKNQLESFYIFTGSERVRMSKCLDVLKFGKKTTVSSIGALVKAYASKDLLGGRKILIYKGEDLCEDTLKILQTPSNNLAIIIMEKVDKRQKLFKSLKNIVEFDEMQKSSLMYIVDEAVGLELDEKLVDKIIQRCNNDVGRVESESHKLRLLIKSGVKITEDVIEDNITPNTEDIAFSLVNAIVTKNSEKTFKLIQDMLITKENPVVIILLLYRQFRNIMIIQGYKDESPKDIAMKTGLNSNMVYAIKNNIGAFSMKELADIIKILNDTDVKIKRGELDMYLGLEIAAIKILEI